MRTIGGNVSIKIKRALRTRGHLMRFRQARSWWRGLVLLVYVGLFTAGCVVRNPPALMELHQAPDHVDTDM